jgi:hypothetical protein
MLPQFECGQLSVSQKGELEHVIHQYPEVLMEQLGLTHLLEYDIQVLENTPVRSPSVLIVTTKDTIFKGAY